MLFPDSIKDNKYTKRKRIQKIGAKDFVTRKLANYKINREAYIIPNLTDETEDIIMNSILADIFGILEGLGEEKENISENKKLKTSKNNIIIKFSLNNVGIILDCMDYIQKIYLSQLAIITNDDVREIKDNIFLTIKKNIDSELYYF